MAGSYDVRMKEFIGSVWFPTSVSVALNALGWAIVTSSRMRGWLSDPYLVLILGPTVTAIIVVPLAWRCFVMPRRLLSGPRAVLAGATSGALILTAPIVIADHSNGLEDLVLILMLSVGAVVGAVAGALVAYAQRRWSHPSVGDSRAPFSTWDGVIGGLMATTLLAPIVGVYAAPLLRPDGSRGFAYFIWSWLILLPVGAAVGAWAWKRWNKIMARW